MADMLDHKDNNGYTTPRANPSEVEVERKQ
jgi:hypothetical protein